MGREDEQREPVAGPEASDEALAARAQAGDEAAFRALYERHAPALRQRVQRRLGDVLRRKVGESDVVQMAYLSAHQGLEHYEDRGDGSFRAWFDRIVERRITDVVRHYAATAKRGIQREVAGTPTWLDGAVPGPEPTPSAVAVGAELRGRIDRALKELSPDHQEILRLVQGEHLTLAQAGERMGRSTGAAKQLYARALRQLRQRIRDEPGERDA